MCIPFDGVQSPRMTPGIYLAHKAVGETSFSLVQQLMEEIRLSGLRRDKLPVCHGGVLDPFAEGLVLLLAGQATRLMDLLHPIPKTYVAEIGWGLETGSGDLLGQMTKRSESPALTEAQLESALPAFLGWQEQVPPATSNKRIDGERAYEKAHRGEEVVLPPSRVYLHSARWLSHDLPRTSVIELVTRGGYYVRAFARDLGRLTGAFGHLTKLRRTAIGPWQDPGPREPHAPRGEAIRGPQLYPWCPSVEVTQRELDLLRGGQGLAPRAVGPPEWRLPDGFPDPEAPLRALLGGSIVAMLRERDGKLLGAPVLRGPL
jgi:tRNA pseudouridine55 synthase